MATTKVVEEFNLDAKVTVKNIGTEERTPELYPIMVESGAFANGSELSAFLNINENRESQRAPLRSARSNRPRACRSGRPAYQSRNPPCPSARCTGCRARCS